MFARLHDVKWSMPAMTARLALHELAFRTRLTLGSWLGPRRLRTVCRNIRRNGFAIIPGYVIRNSCPRASCDTETACRVNADVINSRLGNSRKIHSHQPTQADRSIDDCYILCIGVRSVDTIGSSCPVDAKGVHIYSNIGDRDR